MTTATRDSAEVHDHTVQDMRAINDVADELNRARWIFHGTFASAHEGYGVLLEELRELETEVFKKRERRDVALMRKEALQVAAMAIRFASDVTPIVKS